MHKPYFITLIAATVITAILFLLDSDPYNFEWRSIVGYVVVGVLYITAIWLVLSAVYWIAGRIVKVTGKLFQS